MSVMPVMEALGKMRFPPVFPVEASSSSSAAAGGDANSSGASSNASSPIPAGFVDSFLATASRGSPLMQVVLFVYRLLGAQLGIDPSVIITVLGFLWGFSKLVSQLNAAVRSFVDRYLMSSMAVSENDTIYTHLMKWLSERPSIQNYQYLMAQTVWKSAWEDEDGLEESLFWTDGGEGDDSRKYLNFSSHAARSSPRYVPAMGRTAFWYKGTYFRVDRKKESLINSSGWSPMKDVEEIKISCFGRSIDPIKQLLADAKTQYYEDTYQKTAIYRPRNKDFRRDHNMWQQVARRPVRPMRTVVLDANEKHSIMADVNEYLHPATPRWYAARGIPLRRGYLFHGPPGTGKTSFSFALAGVFGIDIYVISLQDVNVTEEDLAALFAKLPRRCIVLLEDIDTAGLKRDDDDDDDESESEEEEDEKEEGEADDKKDDEKSSKKKAKDKKANKKKKKEEEEEEAEEAEAEAERLKAAKAKKPAGRGRGGRGGKGGRGSGRRGGSSTTKLIAPEMISLSGLLNAIDGVASHEGRVLIMTTNKPESLDDALVRPGRVDMQVGFGNATGDQAAELFHRMYEVSWTRMALEPAAEAPDEKKKAAGAAAGTGAGDEQADDDITTEELRGIAEQFGALVPADMFSPAEIQGFLLKRKKSPRAALDDAPGWIEAAMRQKQAKSKVTTVQ